MEKELIDLSHPISNLTCCTFNKDDIIPKLSFLEATNAGTFYIDSQLDNLNLSFGTHICFPGSLPSNKVNLNTTQFIKKVGDYPLNRFVGNILILDFSYKFVNIKNFFDKTGKLKIDFSDHNQILQFLSSL